jgi:hypothetical protein
MRPEGGAQGGVERLPGRVALCARGEHRLCGQQDGVRVGVVGCGPDPEAGAWTDLTQADGLGVRAPPGVRPVEQLQREDAVLDLHL